MIWYSENYNMTATYQSYRAAVTLIKNHDEAPPLQPKQKQTNMHCQHIIYSIGFNEF